MKNNITIVTASMNRTDQVEQNAATISGYSFHHEHLILDFSSAVPIERSSLPDDKRIKLLRVDGMKEWWLSLAYNYLFSQSKTEYILKVDADCAPSADIANYLEGDVVLPDLMCSHLALRGHRLEFSLFESTGFFLVSRSAIEQVRGFNPLIRHWGWDDLDFFCRVFMSGFSLQCFPYKSNVTEMKHDHSRRFSGAPGENRNEFNYKNLREATNSLNSLVASWSIRTGFSQPPLHEYPDIVTNHEQINSFKEIVSDILRNDRQIRSEVILMYSQKSRFKVLHTLVIRIFCWMPKWPQLWLLKKMGIS